MSSPREDLKYYINLVFKAVADVRGFIPVLKEVLLWVKCYQRALMLQRNHPWKEESINSANFQSSSIFQSCLILCDPMNCSMPGFPVYCNPWLLLRLVSIESVMPSNHLIFCRPLLLPPSIFVSIRVSSSPQVAKVLEFQIQHQSFQSIFRADLL